jgi:hypothetical protein
MKYLKKFEAVSGKSMNKVYDLTRGRGKTPEIESDLEQMKAILSDIEDFSDVKFYITTYFPRHIDIMINKDNWYQEDNI